MVKPATSLIILIASGILLSGCMMDQYDDSNFFGPTAPKARVAQPEDIKRCQLLNVCPNGVEYAWMGPGSGINCVCANDGQSEDDL